MDSRAAVFTSSPQAVEVHQAGTWWSGELLGWRHDASGTCQMWVRVVVGGVEETAWIDLAALRLPGDTSAAADSGGIDSRVKQELPPAQAISALRGRPVAGDVATTAALPLIRDEVATVAADAVARSADPGTPTAIPVRRPGGRRRAPEESQGPVAAPARTTVAAGRHRAPGGEGRHRAADTEVFPAVAEVTDRFAAVPADGEPVVEPRRAARPHVGAGWTVPPARSARPEESYGRSEVCAGRNDAEPDLLTRPMRLSDLALHARRPRVGGSLAGA